MSFRKSTAVTVLITFIFTCLGSIPHGVIPAYAGIQLPAPGSMVSLSPAFTPVLIKGLKIHPENPLNLDFIVDTGNQPMSSPNGLIGDPNLKQESNKLIKYFFAALTLPEKDVWVNLSPYEKDRIVPDSTGQTEMGRDMLAQDYILKQITASLIYPEKGIGKNFWDKIYKEAQARFGTTEVPVNTFNKVWIVADKASIYEVKDTVMVVDSHLKVMLEEDYRALDKNKISAQSPRITLEKQQEQHSDKFKGISSLSSQIIREIILPALEKEVNEGKNFANLRQIFHSLILAKWYKENLKTALLNQVYSDKNKVAGVVIPADVGIQNMDKEVIYQQYLQAYKKGVFNYIKEDINQVTKETTPRKYFSGGVTGQLALTKADTAQASRAGRPIGDLALVAVNAQTSDTAMTTPADFEEANKSVQTTANFQRLSDILGFTAVGVDTKRQFIGDVSVAKHDMRTAAVAYQVASRLGLNAPKASFLGLVHDYGALPFRHFAIQGQLKKEIEASGFNGKAHLVDLLKKDGFNLGPEVINDLLNFDIAKADQLSPEGSVAIAAESIEGVVEDIFFGLKYKMISYQDISTALKQVLGLNVLTEKEVMQGIEDDFDGIVTRIATAVLLEGENTVKTIVEKARTIKQQARQELIVPKIFNHIDVGKEVAAVEKILMPVYERELLRTGTITPANQLRALDTLSRIKETDVLTNFSRDTGLIIKQLTSIDPLTYQPNSQASTQTAAAYDIYASDLAGSDVVAQLNTSVVVEKLFTNMGWKDPEGNKARQNFFRNRSIAVLAYLIDQGYLTQDSINAGWHPKYQNLFFELKSEPAFDTVLKSFTDAYNKAHDNAMQVSDQTIKELFDFINQQPKHMILALPLIKAIWYKLSEREKVAKPLEPDYVLPSGSVGLLRNDKSVIELTQAEFKTLIQKLAIHHPVILEEFLQQQGLNHIVYDEQFDTNIETAIIKLLNEEFLSKPMAFISPAYRLQEDLSLDSLDFEDIKIRLEDKFDLPEISVRTKFKRVADIIRYVQQQKNYRDKAMTAKAGAYDVVSHTSKEEAIQELKRLKAEKYGKFIYTTTHDNGFFVHEISIDPKQRQDFDEYAVELLREIAGQPENYMIPETGLTKKDVWSPTHHPEDQRTLIYVAGDNPVMGAKRIRMFFQFAQVIFLRMNDKAPRPNILGTDQEKTLIVGGYDFRIKTLQEVLSHLKRRLSMPDRHSRYIVKSDGKKYMAIIVKDFSDLDNKTALVLEQLLSLMVKTLGVDSISGTLDGTNIKVDGLRYSLINYGRMRFLAKKIENWINQLQLRVDQLAAITPLIVPQVVFYDDFQLLFNARNKVIGKKFTFEHKNKQPLTLTVTDIEPNMIWGKENTGATISIKKENFLSASLLESDNAMISKGGIDLDVSKIDMQKSGSGVDIKFDPAVLEQFKQGNFNGIVPVIINITPIASMLPLLGLSPSRDPEVLAKI